MSLLDFKLRLTSISIFCMTLRFQYKTRSAIHQAASLSHCRPRRRRRRRCRCHFKSIP